MSTLSGEKTKVQAGPDVHERVASVLRHLRRRPQCGSENGIAAHQCGSPQLPDLEDFHPDQHMCSSGASAMPTNSIRKNSADCNLDPNAIFDPARYEDVRRPLLEATTLPSECYTSQAWFDKELEMLFDSWTLVGRADEMADPGDYIALDTEWGGPVVVCRGKNGRLYAFANVCCHRGAKVVPDGKGKGSALGLVCPYHAWTYDFDGTLKWAPGMQHTKDFDEWGVQLAPVRLDEFHGFVFICVSAEAPPLLDSLGDLPHKLPEWFGDQGECQDMVCVQRREYVVECNWKFLMENTCETYHTSVVHRASLGPMKSNPMGEHRGEWDAVVVPTDRSVVPLPDDFEGEQFPLPAFADRTAFVNIFPSLQMNATWDCVWWMRLLPVSVTTTQICMGFCFPRATVSLPRFPVVLERYLHRWHTAVTEDNAISLNQQRGVRSIFRVPGRLGQLEFGNHNFNNWLVAKAVPGLEGTWDPGRRLVLSTADAVGAIGVDGATGPCWSNDDPTMMKLAGEAAI